ncbi:hypothetical protein SCALM49S_08282 [Streptomyces californicus]
MVRPSSMASSSILWKTGVAAPVASAPVAEARPGPDRAAARRAPRSGEAGREPVPYPTTTPGRRPRSSPCRPRRHPRAQRGAQRRAARSGRFGRRRPNHGRLTPRAPAPRARGHDRPDALHRARRGRGRRPDGVGQTAATASRRASRLSALPWMGTRTTASASALVSSGSPHASLPKTQAAGRPWCRRPVRRRGRPIRPRRGEDPHPGRPQALDGLFDGDADGDGQVEERTDRGADGLGVVEVDRGVGQDHRVRAGRVRAAQDRAGVAGSRTLARTATRAGFASRISWRASRGSGRRR